MTAYVIANLWDVRIGPGIVEYLERIDATLKPYEGRFLIHGAEPEVVEGTWKGVPVVVEFPDMDALRAWYDSPEYQAILPLRTDNSAGDLIVLPGVSPDHKATDILR
ncbi:DUF1330 domain-containing protein [Spirillospora sp. CA-294931]|uniref:DUF1330 domain-containing protein n=1 Tax=Spirillospora sp. CA-294931 TaxID=3240042 RepID=UPI003D928282